MGFRVGAALGRAPPGPSRGTGQSQCRPQRDAAGSLCRQLRHPSPSWATQVRLPAVDRGVGAGEPGPHSQTHRLIGGRPSRGPSQTAEEQDGNVPKPLLAPAEPPLGASVSVAPMTLQQRPGSSTLRSVHEGLSPVPAREVSPAWSGFLPPRGVPGSGLCARVGGGEAGSQVARAACPALCRGGGAVEGLHRHRLGLPGAPLPGEEQFGGGSPARRARSLSVTFQIGALGTAGAAWRWPLPGTCPLSLASA